MNAALSVCIGAAFILVGTAMVFRHGAPSWLIPVVLGLGCGALTVGVAGMGSCV